MDIALLNEYKSFVQGGFETYLPILILTVSVAITFAIANQLAFFIKKMIRARV